MISVRTRSVRNISTVRNMIAVRTSKKCKHRKRVFSKKNSSVRVRSVSNTGKKY